MKNFAIGLGIGLVVAIIVLIIMAIKRSGDKKAATKEQERLKMMLADRMDLESDGLLKIRSENEELKKQNENLRITVNTYSQKPGRKEIARLNVYQTSVDRLNINTPGFGAAWQARSRRVRRSSRRPHQAPNRSSSLIPVKTDANILQIEED